jgi:hypothetical protein
MSSEEESSWRWLIDEANKDKREEFSLDNELVVMKAKENRIKVQEADNYTLQIDINSEEDYHIFTMNYQIVAKHLTVREVEEYLSVSKYSHKHIIITLVEPLSEMERICLQACLGSDRTREALNYFRSKQGLGKAIVLFDLESALDKEPF